MDKELEEIKKFYDDYNKSLEDFFWILEKFFELGCRGVRFNSTRVVLDNIQLYFESLYPHQDGPNIHILDNGIQIACFSYRQRIVNIYSEKHDAIKAAYDFLKKEVRAAVIEKTPIFEKVEG